MREQIITPIAVTPQTQEYLLQFVRNVDDETTSVPQSSHIVGPFSPVEPGTRGPAPEVGTPPDDGYRWGPAAQPNRQEHDPTSSTNRFGRYNGRPGRSS